MVQTLKLALRKICLVNKASSREDKIATIVMGYRMNTYKSLAHCSPYYLLCGRQPLLGRSVSNKLRTFDEPPHRRGSARLHKATTDRLFCGGYANLLCDDSVIYSVVVKGHVPLVGYVTAMVAHYPWMGVLEPTVCHTDHMPYECSN